MRWNFSFLAVFLFILCGCGAPDQSLEKKASGLAGLRGDFQFSVNSGSKEVTGLARFSFSANATGISLPGAEFYFDGQLVLPDSTEMNGVFYEIQIPYFFREHTMGIKADGEMSSEKFTPVLFSLEPGFSDVSRNQDLEFRVTGADDGEDLLVSMVDTNFDNNDILRKFTVSGGKLVIPAALLQQLEPGPISIEVNLDKKLPLKGLRLRRAVAEIRQAITGEFVLK